MTDNAAILAGYTKEVQGESQNGSLYLLVEPTADLDGSFKAWDMDMQEFIRVNGWLYTFDEAEGGIGFGENV